MCFILIYREYNSFLERFILHLWSRVHGGPLLPGGAFQRDHGLTDTSMVTQERR